jgi:hypothetical protein
MLAEYAVKKPMHAELAVKSYDFSNFLKQVKKYPKSKDWKRSNGFKNNHKKFFSDLSLKKIVLRMLSNTN